MSFAQLLSEDRRLAMLRLLAEAPQYQINTSVMQSALGGLGHRCSRDVVETEAAWLAEQGLVTIEDLGPVRVLTLARRGADVASGVSSIPGVKRPAPRG